MAPFTPSFPAINPPHPALEGKLVSKLIDPDTNQWNAQIIRETFLPFEADDICRIPLSYRRPEDKIIWHHSKQGLFTVKSAYRGCAEVENKG